MGVWDDLQSSVSRLINRKLPGKHPSEADAFEAKPATAFVSITKVADAVKVGVAQKLDESFPHPHRAEKVGKILSNIGKFAVESAVKESLKGVTGALHVYKIVKEGLTDEPDAHPRNDIKKQHLMIAVEEVQAKMEKLQEEVNILKQQNQISTEYSGDLEPLKESPDEPIKSAASSETDRKKVFIRSRL